LLLLLLLLLLPAGASKVCWQGASRPSCASWQQTHDAPSWWSTAQHQQRLLLRLRRARQPWAMGGVTPHLNPPHQLLLLLLLCQLRQLLLRRLH
jgi:hypothetical protein